jgi:hypothetical protein
VFDLFGMLPGRLLLPNSPAKSHIHPWAPEAKVFWFFSSEKNMLAAGHGYAEPPHYDNLAAAIFKKAS